jgi:hypothetical protein
MLPESVLADIRSDCDAVIDACGDALESPLTTEDEGDDPTARNHLERALKAARELRTHLDDHYENVNGFLEVKERDATD